jgi:hypothetical protein
MDPSDKDALHQLSQALSQGHIDVNSIVNHGIVVAVTFWLVIGAIVIATLFFRYKARADRMKLLQTLAEKGQPIPPELLNGALGSTQTGPVNYITRGVVLVSIGLAMIVFFAVAGGAFAGTMHGDDWAGPVLGAFPLFLGLAYLGIGVYQRRHG